MTEEQSYADAFYAIASVLGMSARAESPKHVFETEMLPRIKALVEGAQPNPLHVANERGEEVKDAARYRRFFDAGLPITFMGVEYDDKASLDAAIDADLAQEEKT